MKPGEKMILPVWFRTGVLSMIAVALIGSFCYRLTGDNAQHETQVKAHGRAIESQSLHFVDLDKGVISVINAHNKKEIIRLQSGEHGFMRSVMRGLAQERKAHGLGPEIPFELTVWEDGLVSLIDPATQRRVELSAFGKDNVAAFTQLLPSAAVRTSVDHSSPS
jgi:putative photosynthetic complex assembly protein